jgi:ubiquinone/menaquinone biosynthesis C-methylase UbiE
MLDATVVGMRAGELRAAALALAALLLSSCVGFKRCAYEGGSRDAWQQPERVIAALGIQPGERVADLGSGSGYFTLRLARAVGPGGRVFAVDIDQQMNDYVRERATQAGIGNIEVILARTDDPLLPDGAIDLVFTSDTYHHLGDRSAYFRDLKRDLAPGARVAVLDFDGRKGWFVRIAGHYTPRELVLAEMRDAGYAVEAEFDFIDRQLFLVFRPMMEDP